MGDIYTPEKLQFNPNGETITCLLVCLFLCILFIYAGIRVKCSDPLKRPKGIVLLADWGIEKLDNFVKDLMGQGFENFGGILLGVICFLFCNMIIGITGLPSPMVYIPVPLSLGLVTFLLIHITSIRYTGWKYFKRYVDPLPVFLPINLLSMWAPLLSLTLRLFGNAIAGWVLLTLVDWALSGAMAAIPFATPLLHAYFDVFSSYIQTLVFTFLTCLFVVQERPEIEEPLTVGSRKENI